MTTNKESATLNLYLKNRDAMKQDPTYPVFELGFNQGKQETANLVLGHLQDKYISGVDRPERGSPQAQYLLGLASELADLIRETKP